MDEARKAAFDALNRAIDMLAAANDMGGHIVTDAVLVIGTQAINEDGYRVGATGLFLKDGVQPIWTTRALINEAAMRVSACACATGE